MNRFIFTFLSPFFLLLMLSVKPVSTQAAEEPVVALAIQEKLRVPVYYAATFGRTPQSMDAFINDPMNFKMEARYIVDKYSARRNHQMWLNALLTANSRESLKQFDKALLKFSNLIKTDMFKGDRLEFNINPVRGTVISINGTSIGSIDDLKFQVALVATWFGDRGTSKKFVQAIHKAPNSKDLRAYNDLKITNSNKSRFKSIKTATQKQTALISKPKNTQVKTKVAAIKPKITPKKEVVTKVPLPKVNKAIGDKAIKKQLEATQTKQATTQIKKELPKPQPKTAEISPQVKPQAKPTKAKAIEKIKPKQANTKIAKAEPLSVVEQMFRNLKLDYQSDLKQYIEHNARPVPPLKVRKKPQGQAKFRVSLAMVGDKIQVKDSQALGGNLDESLYDSMHSALKRLKSMPPAPEAIAEQSFSVEVELDFSRCKRATSTWICF